MCEKPIVTEIQNGGNMLAGGGPCDTQRGWMRANREASPLAIVRDNTGQCGEQKWRTPDGTRTYARDAEISGVPGTAAPIPLAFRDTAGARGGALLPKG